MCGVDSDPDRTLLCDLCDAECHVYCAGLAAIPDGDWHCPSCVAQRHQTSAAEGRGMAEPLTHLMTTQLQPGCVICGIDSEPDKTLLCDSCEDEYHTFCLKMKKPPRGDWFCANCQDAPAHRKDRVSVHMHQAWMAVRGQGAAQRLRSQPFLDLPQREAFRDYYELIHAPMSLKLVKTRLRKGEYTDWASFQRDIELIFSNVRIYNRASSRIVKDARQLEQIFDDFKRSVPRPIFAVTASSGGTARVDATPKRSLGCPSADRPLKRPRTNNESPDSTLHRPNSASATALRCWLCQQAVTAEHKRICCDICVRWFHLDCVGLIDAAAVQIGNWACGECQRNSLRRKNAEDVMAATSSAELSTATRRTGFDDTFRRRARSIGNTTISICICRRQQQADTLYIMCHLCKERFHPPCVGLFNDAANIKRMEYTCARCRAHFCRNSPSPALAPDIVDTADQISERGAPITDNDFYDTVTVYEVTGNDRRAAAAEIRSVEEQLPVLLGMELCVLCGSSGSSESFIFCAHCGESFHRKCLHTKFDLQGENAESWLCLGCLRCGTCGSMEGKFRQDSHPCCFGCTKL